MSEIQAAALRTFTLFDTCLGQKQPFVPQNPGKVQMYVCGVTVYDLTHIGHARVFIFFDLVQRFIRHLGYELTYVRNHTDVDDKIIKRAQEQGIDPLTLAAHFIEELNHDMGELGVAHADVEPKVSEHIEPIVEMIERLVDRGHAYAAEGDVYFRIKSFPSYGKLSHRKLEDMEAGRSGRVDEESTRKEHPFDFALWKGAKDGEPGWSSPWGQGRPGWHIECSAMSNKYLGDTFDIHGGGRDLIFPHHENEIAQSEAATGHAPFARYWLHVGMVNVAELSADGERVERKMSKSLGNFWTTRDVLQGYHAEAVRYFMHTTLYRNPITYSLENLEEASARIEYLYTTLQRADELLIRTGLEPGQIPPAAPYLPAVQSLATSFEERFEEALCDDFNTPKALALVSEIARNINELTQTRQKPKPEEVFSVFRLRELLTGAGAILGILQEASSDALLRLRDLRVKALGLDVGRIEALIAARQQARQTKDWAEADRVRAELDALGVEIMDSPEGTTWRVK